MAGTIDNPTLLTIDIAFDWDSKSKGGFDGFCLCGPVGFDMALAGRPWNVRGLTTADQLHFAIYDISDQEASRSVSDLVIKMRSAHDANSSEYPFDSSVMGESDGDGWYPIEGLTIGTRQRGWSAVYGGLFPFWRVSPSRLQLVNAGWFFFKVSLEASEDSDTHKTFGNDPEFIVGPDT